MRLEERATLKNITENDLSNIFNWRNRAPIREVMFNSEVILWEQHCQWFHKLQENDLAITKIFYFDSVPYGVLNIHKKDQENGICEWGFYLGPSSTPKGMGTILGYTALNYIFNELYIRKVSAQVFDYNQSSINYHQKMGFTEEGRLRKHIWKKERYIDILLYGLLRSEWEEHSLVIRNSIERRLV